MIVELEERPQLINFRIMSNLKSLLYYSILGLFFFLHSGTIIAQSNQGDELYLKSMTSNLESLGYCKSIEDYHSLSQDFEKIGDALEDRWRPYYYATFCQINMAFKSDSPDQTDEYLDKAQELIDEASGIEPAESEIYALQALLYQARIKVDPRKRGPEFTKKAEEMLNEAAILNSANPRVYYLLGQNYMAIPEQLGGGPAKACTNYEKAKKLYKKFVPLNLISPRWGEVMNYEAWEKHCR